jgi:excisionase family DNA binding protein
VAPSTIRRWIREGEVPAYRIGRRHVALRRPDLAALIAPIRASTDRGDELASDDHAEIRRLTPEEQRRGLAALEEAQQISKQIMARRGGKPFPPSWETLNELRDERTRQLG